ncbi:hypothetical protein [Xylella fastidiosa]|uniref:hypothetical protein n=1 Tax=Xylella fastidiosa TaxID=2371 RepID=UPI0009B5CC33|nr:hypothetical protein [Xylella fastidiosa]MDG5825124.1 hypothetical protein [Xylella fastidiosa subsp. pauca]
MRELNVVELSLVAGAGAREPSWWNDVKDLLGSFVHPTFGPVEGGGGYNPNVAIATACINHGGSFQGSSFNTSVSAGVGGRPGASASVNIGYSSASCIMPQPRH